MSQPASAVTVVPVSSFDVADTPLAGDEIVPLVQNGETKRTTVSEIAGSALPFLEVTGSSAAPVLGPIDPAALFILRALAIAIQAVNASVSIQEDNASLTVEGSGIVVAPDSVALSTTDPDDPITINGFPIGYKNVPVLVASTRNLLESDAGKGIVQLNAGAELVITIRADATANLGDGFVTTLACANGGGSIRATPAGGVTLINLNDGTTGSQAITGVGIATLWRLGADTWGIHGSQNLAP